MIESIGVKQSGDVAVENRELSGSLSTFKVALLVIAAAAPLGAVVSTAPIGMMLGNGPGLSGAFLIAGLLMICFAVGYSELIKEFPGGGAFFRYLSFVFGGAVGNGTAWVALFSYLCIATALATVTGYFTDLTLAPLGVTLGWKIWTGIIIAAIAILGRLNVDFAARILVTLVVLEFAMLAILAIAIVVNKGSDALPLGALRPEVIFSPGIGVSMMIALAAFLGIESAALYAPEARNAGVTIPRATRLAVILVAIAYFFSVWIIIGDLGWETVKEQALNDQGNLILAVFEHNLGHTAMVIVSLMLCSSNFACFLSLHNAAARYVHTLANNGGLPSKLGMPHKKYDSPSAASLCVSLIVTVMVVVPSFMGYDPYVYLFPVALALGTVGLLSLQTAVSLAVVKHFSGARKGRLLVTLLFPSVAFCGLVTAVYLICENYSLLTGSESWLINSTPVLLLVVFAYGWLAKYKKGA